jgi:hypothetical protein
VNEDAQRKIGMKGESHHHLRPPLLSYYDTNDQFRFWSSAAG